MEDVGSIAEDPTRMIRDSNEKGALLAISAVVAAARQLAVKGDVSELASILDTAEYLPLLMLDSCDCTVEFRVQIVGLARQFNGFAQIVEVFDSGGRGEFVIAGQAQDR